MAQIESAEGLWLHEHYELSLTEFAELSGLTEAELRAWVDEGLLTPIDPQAMPWTFAADRLTMVQMVCRLRRDFELEPQGLALVAKLLDQVHALEAEIRELRARLPHSIR